MSCEKEIHTKACEVRKLVEGLPKLDRQYLGGVPFTENLEREMQTWDEVKKKGLPDRKRVCLGFCFLDDDGSPIGYQVLTVMTGATPTKYEQEYNGLRTPLNYVQGRYLVVHPDYRGTRVASNLMTARLKLAEYWQKDWVVDVLAENGRVIAFLDKFGISPQFGWKAKSGVKMVRCFRAHQGNEIMSYSELINQVEKLTRLT